ncbi:MAG: hypothetical protein P4L72_15810 [Parvibaculum sp.]|uniref:hypothetical protein n=1 Tax=Parvibaculum sp. TaxID=2024848 RepID=UPI00284B2808|nr:hypothetical protein [Parvibaculum sp.]MDR3500680.1 hypothetical protein [Parvibaculum sp.]
MSTSLIATYLYGMISYIMTRRRFNVEGVWAEYIPGSIGHQYSLGRIYHDKRRKIYAFDGTNYRNDGKKYCHWETVTSYVDVDRQKYFYTFNAQIEGELDKVYYGFGVVNLMPNNAGVLVPSDAHYISASVDGKAMSHSMIRAIDMSYSRTSTGADVITLVNANQ